jgi:hypothetical protein
MAERSNGDGRAAADDDVGRTPATSSSEETAGPALPAVPPSDLAPVQRDAERFLARRRVDGTAGKKRQRGGARASMKGRLTLSDGRELHQSRLLAMYLRLGPRRDRLRRVAKKYRVTELWLSRVAAEYGWTEKAIEYDRAFEAAVTDAALRDHVEQARRDLADVDELRRQVMDRVRTAKVKVGTLEGAVASMARLIEVGRLLLNLPTSRAEVIDRAEVESVYLEMMRLARDRGAGAARIDATDGTGAGNGAAPGNGSGGGVVEGAGN